MRLGWCSDGHHGDCRGTLPASNDWRPPGSKKPVEQPERVCSCDCHTREDLRHAS